MKQITYSQATEIINKNKTILVTGSFDILHVGHVHFLKWAKEQVGQDGKLLVIALDDKNIRERKGPDRPVFSQTDRLDMLAALECVDYVMVWDKEWQLLREFVAESTPTYLAVVEGDPGLNNKRQVIEASGGELKVFPKQSEHSTSKIVNILKQEFGA